MKTYTIKELEPILKRKPKTITRYIKNGRLPASKLFGRYWITEEDVKVFLEENRVS